ncbi:MAG: metal-sulfur cluster assembly factor [Rhodocyclaceae bacterium]|jgi:metal-sulfur cluster biosynthetic enzyme|nr:metal-sulfur cluster assembly factor [Rhodocyclaceae bacterium]
MPSEDQVREALRSIIDPEAGMNIVDLGLIYRVDAMPGRVAIEMTMTTPACPVGPMLVDQVRDAVRAIASDAEIAVELVWEPPWHAGLMSERAKKHFGW